MIGETENKGDNNMSMGAVGTLYGVGVGQETRS